MVIRIHQDTKCHLCDQTGKALETLRGFVCPKCFGRNFECSSCGEVTTPQHTQWGMMCNECGAVNSLRQMEVI